MTPQEHEKLQQFLSQLSQAQGVQRDPEADAMITAAVSRQPDSAYLLVQRTLLQDLALEAARVRIAELEKKVQAAPAPATSFLGAADAWGNSARSRTDVAATGAPLPSYPQPGNAPMAPAYQAGNPAAAQAQPRGGFLGGMGGGGNFLGTMAATAAGVAGGAFLFQGLGSLMGNNAPKDAATPHAAASDTAAPAPAADNSLAQEAGVNDVAAAQEPAAVDDTAAYDDGDMPDDFGGGDDSMA
ncbi:MAG: DUF2076 family protein [Noviherbaspirillum sp.]